jgi:hypothetical protein
MPFSVTCNNERDDLELTSKFPFSANKVDIRDRSNKFNKKPLHQNNILALK